MDDGAEGAEVVQHGTRHVRVDDRDRLWLSRRGVLVYDGEKWHPFSAGLPDVHFSDTRLTYEDSEGNIWVGLWGGGLIFCDPISIQLYDKKDGLPDNEVRRLSEDQEGRIWIGTTGGLACLEDGRDPSGGGRLYCLIYGSRSTRTGLERRPRRTSIQIGRQRNPSDRGDRRGCRNRDVVPRPRRGLNRLHFRGATGTDRSKSLHCD